MLSRLSLVARLAVLVKHEMSPRLPQQTANSSCSIALLFHHIERLFEERREGVDLSVQDTKVQPCKRITPFRVRPIAVRVPEKFEIGD